MNVCIRVRYDLSIARCLVSWFLRVDFILWCHSWWARRTAARCCGVWPACWQLGRDYVGPEMDDWVLWVRKPSDRCRLSPLSEHWWLDDVTALVLLNVAQYCTLVVLLCWVLGSQSPSRVVPLVLGRGPALPVFMPAVPWTVRPGRRDPSGDRMSPRGILSTRSQRYMNTVWKRQVSIYILKL